MPSRLEVTLFAILYVSLNVLRASEGMALTVLRMYLPGPLPGLTRLIVVGSQWVELNLQWCVWTACRGLDDLEF